MNLFAIRIGLVFAIFWMLFAGAASAVSVTANGSVITGPVVLVTGDDKINTEINDHSHPDILIDNRLLKLALSPNLLPQPNHDGLPLIKVQNYPTNASVMLRVENPTGQDLHVFFVPETGGERPYVAPVNQGQFIEIPTDQGQVFAFSDGQDWVGGLYSVAEAGRQTITLPIAEGGNVAAATAGRTGASLTIRIENNSGQALQIHALSPDGASAPQVGQVGANSFTTISGETGQVIGVSDGQNWIGAQYTVTADASQTARFPIDANASQGSTAGANNNSANNSQSAGGVVVRLRNPTDRDYQIHVISPDRSQAPLVGTAKAQFANDLPFLPGQTLGFSDGTNWVGDQYVVTSEGGQVLTLPYSQSPIAAQGSATQSGGKPGGEQSATSGQPAIDAANIVTLRIENPTAQALQVHIIPPDGSNAPVVGHVNAGAFVNLPTSHGATIGFSDGNNWIGETYVVAAAPNQTVSLPFAGATQGAATQTDQTSQTAQRSQANDTPASQQIVQIGDGSIPVRVENPTQAQLVIHEILPDGSGAPEVARVEAGFFVDMPAQAGALVGFSNGSDWVGGQYSVTADAGQRVSLPLAAPAAQVQITPIGDGSQPLGISNPTQQALLVHYITPDKSAAPVVAEVAPQTRIDLPGQVGALIGVSDGNDWVGAQYTITADAAQEINIPLAEKPQENVRAQLGDGSVWVEFHNPTGETLAIHHLLEGGNDAPFVTEVGAGGGALRLPAQAGFKIGIANVAGWVGGTHTVTAQRMQRLTLPLPEGLPPVAQIGNGLVTLQVSNPQALPILVHHIPGGDQDTVVVAKVMPGAKVDIPAQPGVKVGFAVEGRDSWFGSLYQVNNQVKQPVSLPAPIVVGGAAIKTRLQNPTNKTFEVYKIDGEQTLLVGSAPSGTVTDLLADPNMKFAFSSGGPFVGGYLKVTNRNNQTLRFPAPMQAGNGRMAFTVSNRSGKQLSVVSVPLSGNGDAEVLGTLEVGATAVIKADQGMKIGFVDEHGYLGGQHEVTNSSSAGPLYLPLPVTIGDGSVSMRIRNIGGSLLSVNRIGSDNQPHSLGMVRSGETLALKSPPCTMIGFANATTGDWVGGMYQINRKDGQQVNIPRAQDSDPGKCQILTTQQLNAAVVKIAVDQAKALQADKSNATYCWKNTKYRQASVRLPDHCNSRLEEQAGLCYNKCNPKWDYTYKRQVKYSGNVTMCVPECPPGFQDHGLSCWKPAPYTRKEYPVDFGEALKTFGSWFGGSNAGTGLSGAMARCRADARRAGKPTNVCRPANGDTIVYENCKAGFHQAPFPPNVCTADCPSGMKDGGQNCWKNTYDRGVGKLKECGPGLEMDPGGLCYSPCGNGYSGVGPVCWAQCPANLSFNCGMGCAATEAQCGIVMTEQVMGPVMLAANVAIIAGTLGTGTGGVAAANVARQGATATARVAAKIAAKAAAKAAAKVALKRQVADAIRRGAVSVAKNVVKDLVVDTAISGVLTTSIWGAMSLVEKDAARAAVREAYDARYSSGAGIDDAVIEAAVNAALEGAEKSNPLEDFPWDSLDPTGIASIVVAYNFPQCSDVK